MKLLLSAAVATAALLAASAASAQTITGVYGNLGYSHITDELGDDGDEDVSLGAITGRIGARVLPWLAIEGQASLGVIDEEESEGGVTVTASLNHEVGVYAVGMFPVSPNADIFARAGFGLADFELEARGPGTGNLRAEEDATYRALGVGGQFFWDGVNGVRGDYTYLDFYNEDAKADVFSIAYVRKF